MKIKNIAVCASLLFLAHSKSFAENNYDFDSEAMSFRRSTELINDELMRLASDNLREASEKFNSRFSGDASVTLLADIDIYDKDYKNADLKLADFIKNRPNSPFIAIAAIKRAYMAFQNKDYKNAEKLFAESKAISEKELNDRKDSSYYVLAHESIFWQAVAVFHQGRFQDAQPIFEECHRKYPDGKYADDALFALGLSAEINKNYEVAVTYYKTLTKKYPHSNNFISARIREANNYLILKDHINALTAIDNAEYHLAKIKANSEESKHFEPQTNIENAAEETLYLKAESYNLAGNLEQAEKYYTEFIEKYPSSKMINYARLGLGWVYLNNSKNDKALFYYDQIIASAPETNHNLIASAQLFRAVALKRSGDIQQAKKELSAIVVQPDFPLLGKALLELGQIYYEIEDYENSARNLQRAERESADAGVIIKIKLLLGANYSEQRKWSQAYQEYKAAEQLALKSQELFLPKKAWYLAESRLKQGIALVNNSKFKEAIPPLLAFLSDARDDERADEATFWLSEAYYRSDMLKNSIETYQNLLRRFPSSNRREEAMYGLGWSYFRLKNFKESSATFDDMIKSYPNSKFALEVLARQGDGYYVTKNFAKAIESYKKAIKIDSQGEEGQYCSYQLCHAYFKTGAYDEAVRQLMTFVKKYPNSPFADNAMYLVGWIKFQQKKYAEAIENFKYMTASYPSSPLKIQAQYAIGDAYYNMEKFDAAISSYKDIVEKYPSSPLAGEALRSMQYCLESLGRMDEALKITDSFIAANPESPFAEEFKYKKAEMFYTGNKYSDAISEYNSFIKQYPESEKAAEALYWMAKSYVNMSDTVNAGKTYDEVATKYPKSEYAPLSLIENGVFQKSVNNIDKATALFESARKKYLDNPITAQAGFELANIRIAVGDTNKALEILNEVIYKYSNNEYADQSRYKIAMYYKINNKVDSAAYHFEALSKSEFNIQLAAEAEYRLGEMKTQIGDYKKAMEYYLKVKEKFSGVEDWFSLSLLGLGECYEKLENIVAAKEIYSSLVALRPDDEFGAAAARRLNEIENK
jgi:TolA-binding protein